MKPYLAAYNNEDQARSALAALKEENFTECRAYMASDYAAAEPAPMSTTEDVPDMSSATASSSASDADPAAALVDGINDGIVPRGARRRGIKALSEGKSLVAVAAPFGGGETVLAILQEDGELLETATPTNPSPLSDTFGIPVLTDSTPSTGLLPHSWSFSSMFGMKLLSSGATPLSSMFGLKTLTAPKKNWKSSFGMPLVINKAAPLSSSVGMPLLKKTPRERNSSFGFPLLSKNPAPLSSLFGLPVLTKRQ